MREKVFSVMDAAVQAGVRMPTLRGVRASIGGGSLTDVAKYIKEWKELHPAITKSAEKNGFSDEMAKRVLVSTWDFVNPMVQALAAERVSEMSLGVEEARRENEELREALFVESQSLDRKMADADRRVADAEKRAEEAEKAFEELSVEHQKKITDLQQNVEAKDKLLRDLNERARLEEQEKKDLLDRLQEQKDLIAMLKTQLPKDEEKSVPEKEATVRSKKETTASRTGELF